MYYINEERTIKRVIRSNCFKVIVSNHSNLLFKDFIKPYDLSKYYIYKATANFREVTIEEFLSFEYSGYILFEKAYYNKEEISNWIEWIKDNNLFINYFSKPFPSYKLTEIIDVY